MPLPALLAFTTLAWLTAGCSAPAHRSTLMSRPSADSAANPEPATSGELPPEDVDRELLVELDLETALAEARAQHPQLAAARAAVDAAAARTSGAGRFPNPELVVRMESAPLSSGSASGNTEYVLGVSQPIPLGDRRGRARRLAEAQQIQATQELAVLGREIDRRVRGAFGTALYAQSVAALQQELLDSSQRRLDVAESRRAAGELLSGDLTQLRHQEALDRIALERSTHLAEQARAALATLLGSHAAVGSVTGDLAESLELPALDELLARLDGSPALLAAEATSNVARARLELSAELLTPDVRFDLFYRRLDATGIDSTDAFDIGLAIPIRAYDSGRARVLEDQARAVRAAALVDSTRLELEVVLRDAHARARHALRGIKLIGHELLPEAERQASTVQRRHAAGDVALAERIEAQRTVVKLRLAHAAAMHEALTAWADLAAFLKASA